jgi:hypothetical protein
MQQEGVLLQRCQKIVNFFTERLWAWVLNSQIQTRREAPITPPT